jgi:hypothetical protein
MLRKALVAAMTRYSRSVIPGRPQESGEAEDSASLDRVIFGSKKKPITPPANDRDNDYPDPMDMDVDEAGFLVERSAKERRSEMASAARRRIAGMWIAAVGLHAAAREWRATARRRCWEPWPDPAGWRAGDCRRIRRGRVERVSRRRADGRS